MRSDRRRYQADAMSIPQTLAPFEPEITAFYCIYCGYMAADTAGALAVQYPANVKFLRLPCTGKTDIRYLLEAFEQGADGVYLVACPIGNCHHVRGNERGRARLQRAKRILDEIAALADELQRHGADLTLVTTSREPLGLEALGLDVGGGSHDARAGAGGQGREGGDEGGGRA